MYVPWRRSHVFLRRLYRPSAIFAMKLLPASSIAKFLTESSLRGYTEEALAILKNKRKGTYNVIQIDPNYRPAPIERKDVFGITFEQGRNEIKLNGPELFENIPTQNKEFPEAARRDLMIALITLKYTQSNSVCYVKDGQAIGIGAGQQSVSLYTPGRQ